MSLNLENILNEIRLFCGDACHSMSNEVLSNFYEFDEFERENLQKASNMERLADALTFLWSDLYHSLKHRNAKHSENVLNCVLLKTSICLCRSETWSDPRSVIHTLCDRIFDALFLENSRCIWPAYFVSYLRKVIVGVVKTNQKSISLDWIRLANSCCAIWPSEIETVFDFLLRRSERYEATLSYISVLAYKTSDHPWISSQTYLWEKYGDSEAIFWSKECVKKLDEFLSVANIRKRLGDLDDNADLRIPSGAPLKSIIEEVLKIQIDLDYPKRRSVLLNHLQNSSHDLYWDDEYESTILR